MLNYKAISGSYLISDSRGFTSLLFLPPLKSIEYPPDASWLRDIRHGENPGKYCRKSNS